MFATTMYIFTFGQLTLDTKQIQHEYYVYPVYRTSYLFFIQVLLLKI